MINNIKTLVSIVNNQSGLHEVSKGLHVQIDEKPQSSTKLWDVILSKQVKDL